MFLREFIEKDWENEEFHESIFMEKVEILVKKHLILLK